MQTTKSQLAPCRWLRSFFLGGAVLWLACASGDDPVNASQMPGGATTEAGASVTGSGGASAGGIGAGGSGTTAADGAGGAVLDGSQEGPTGSLGGTQRTEGPGGGPRQDGAPEAGGGGEGGTNQGNGGLDAGSGGAGGRPMGMGGASPYRPSYILGADISWTLEDESRGAKYADSSGVKPIEEIFANNGFNFVALRTFVCPSCPGGYSSQGWNDDKHTVTMAKRVKACGMGFLLSLMMSDSWSSLGVGGQAAQTPSAWKGMTPSQMQAAAHDYTNRVMKEMVEAGVTPDIVKLGNETNSGMSGIPLSNWTDLSALIAAAMQGIREVNPDIPIWAHNGRPRPDSAGGNGFNAWVDLYLSGKSGTKFNYDGIAVSTYGTTNDGADWIESLSYVLNTYKKPVMAVEYTVQAPDDQAGRIINTKVLRGFANRMGWGSFIWEPTRYPGVNSSTLFSHSGTTYTTNAAMAAYPTLAKSYGLPVPSAKCVGAEYVY